MAARDGERMSCSVWREIHGTSALELVCGPFHPSADADSPKTGERPEEE